MSAMGLDPGSPAPPSPPPPGKREPPAAKTKLTLARRQKKQEIKRERTGRKLIRRNAAARKPSPATIIRKLAHRTTEARVIAMRAVARANAIAAEENRILMRMGIRSARPAADTDHAGPASGMSTEPHLDLKQKDPEAKAEEDRNSFLSTSKNGNAPTTTWGIALPIRSAPNLSGRASSDGGAASASLIDSGVTDFAETQE